MGVMYVTYEEAKQLRRVLEELKETAPWKEVRDSAGRLYSALGYVKDLEYSAGGYQLILSEQDSQFLKDIMETNNVR